MGNPSHPVQTGLLGLPTIPERGMNEKNEKSEVISIFLGIMWVLLELGEGREHMLF